MLRDLAPPLALLVLAPVATFPLAFEAGALMLDLAAPQDAFIFLWNSWWTRLALLGLHASPYSTPWLHPPDGASLALHSYPMLPALLSLPVQLAEPGLPGLLRANNLALVLSFFLASLGTYGLARHAGARRAAALLAGVFYAYSSFRYANLARLHCISTEWLPFFAWLLLRWAQRGRVADALLCSLAALAVLYASLEYAAFASLAAPALLVALIGRGRGRHRWGNLLRPGALIPAVYLLIVGAAPLALALRPHASAPHGFPLPTHFSADLADFFLPGPWHPLFGDAARALGAAWHDGSWGLGASIAWVAWAWAALAVGLCLGRRGDPRLRASPLPWLLLALGALVLSLGPRLHVAGTLYDVALPQAWLRDALPLLRLSRTPVRWLAFAELFLAVAVALAASWLLQLGRGRRLARAAVALSVAALLFEQLPPLEMTPVRIEDAGGGAGDESGAAPAADRGAVVLPAYLSALAAQEGGGSVLFLPSPGCRYQLLAQTVHGKPLIGNMLDCIPHASPASLESLRSGELTLLGQLIRDGHAPGATPGDGSGRRLVRAVRRRFAPGYIAVSRRALDPEQLARAEAYLRAARARAIERYPGVDLYVLGDG